MSDAPPPPGGGPPPTPLPHPKMKPPSGDTTKVRHPLPLFRETTTPTGPANADRMTGAAGKFMYVPPAPIAEDDEDEEGKNKEKDKDEDEDGDNEDEGIKSGKGQGKGKGKKEEADDGDLSGDEDESEGEDDSEMKGKKRGLGERAGWGGGRGLVTTSSGAGSSAGIGGISGAASSWSASLTDTTPATKTGLATTGNGSNSGIGIESDDVDMEGGSRSVATGPSPLQSNLPSQEPTTRPAFKLNRDAPVFIPRASPAGTNPPSSGPPVYMAGSAAPSTNTIINNVDNAVWSGGSKSEGKKKAVEDTNIDFAEGSGSRAGEGGSGMAVGEGSGRGLGRGRGRGSAEDEDGEGSGVKVRGSGVGTGDMTQDTASVQRNHSEPPPATTVTPSQQQAIHHSTPQLQPNAQPTSTTPYGTSVYRAPDSGEGSASAGLGGVKGKGKMKQEGNTSLGPEQEERSSSRRGEEGGVRRGGERVDEFVLTDAAAEEEGSGGEAKGSGSAINRIATSHAVPTPAPTLTQTQQPVEPAIARDLIPPPPIFPEHAVIEHDGSDMDVDSETEGEDLVDPEGNRPTDGATHGDEDGDGGGEGSADSAPVDKGKKRARLSDESTSSSKPPTKKLHAEGDEPHVGNRSGDVSDMSVDQSLERVVEMSEDGDRADGTADSAGLHPRDTLAHLADVGGGDATAEELNDDPVPAVGSPGGDGSIDGLENEGEETAMLESDAGVASESESNQSRNGGRDDLNSTQGEDVSMGGSSAESYYSNPYTGDDWYDESGETEEDGGDLEIHAPAGSRIVVRSKNKKVLYDMVSGEDLDITVTPPVHDISTVSKKSKFQRGFDGYKFEILLRGVVRAVREDAESYIPPYHNAIGSGHLIRHGISRWDGDVVREMLASVKLVNSFAYYYVQEEIYRRKLVILGHPTALKKIASAVDCTTKQYIRHVAILQHGCGRSNDNKDPEEDDNPLEVLQDFTELVSLSVTGYSWDGRIPTPQLFIAGWEENIQPSVEQLCICADVLAEHRLHSTEHDLDILLSQTFPNLDQLVIVIPEQYIPSPNLHAKRPSWRPPNHLDWLCLYSQTIAKVVFLPVFADITRRGSILTVPYGTPSALHVCETLVITIENELFKKPKRQQLVGGDDSIDSSEDDYVDPDEEGEDAEWDAYSLATLDWMQSITAALDLTGSFLWLTTLHFRLHAHLWLGRSRDTAELTDYDLSDPTRNTATLAPTVDSMVMSVTALGNKHTSLERVIFSLSIGRDALKHRATNLSGPVSPVSLQVERVDVASYIEADIYRNEDRSVKEVVVDFHGDGSWKQPETLDDTILAMLSSHYNLNVHGAAEHLDHEAPVRPLLMFAEGDWRP